MPDTLREEWQSEWLVAHTWWCGDEECDCTQPLIERVAPNLSFGYPLTRRERLWEGDFVSEADPQERAAQESQLMAAAESYGIKLNDRGWGRRLYG